MTQPMRLTFNDFASLRVCEFALIAQPAGQCKDQRLFETAHHVDSTKNTQQFKKTNHHNQFIPFNKPKDFIHSER